MNDMNTKDAAPRTLGEKIADYTGLLIVGGIVGWLTWRFFN